MHPLPTSVAEIQDMADKLRRFGDPLERHIACVEPLAKVVEPYAAVWSEHIHPQRGAADGARWPDEWIPFVASHYTALVNIANAHHNYLRLSVLCKSGIEGKHAVAALLQTHNAIDCYWHNVRLAAHHLQTAFLEIPRRDHHEPRPANSSEFKDFNDLNRDRGQHARDATRRLLPTVCQGDSIEINDMMRIEVGGRWQRRQQSAETLRRFHAQHWEECLGDLGETWWKLFAQLQACRDAQTTTCDERARHATGESLPSLDRHEINMRSDCDRDDRDYERPGAAQRPPEAARNSALAGAMLLLAHGRP